MGAVLCRSAAGQAQTHPRAEYRLEFAGSADCHDEAALEGEIEARVPAARRNDAAPTRVVVRVQGSEAGARAHLTIRAPAGESEREIEGADCTTVLRGIAVMLAVYFDEPTQAPAPKPPPPLPAPKPRERLQLERRPGPSSDDARTIRVGALAGGETRTGASAVLLMAAHFGAGLRFERAQGWFSPSFRVVGSYGLGPISSDVGSPWDFRLALVRALACPVRYIASPSVRWHACGIFEVGELSASGPVKLQGASKPELLWIGGGAALTLEMLLGRQVSLEVAASSVVLGKRGRFVEKSDDTFQLNEVPRASVGISLSAVTWLY